MVDGISPKGRCREATEEIPLIGEMSATRTKGLPFLQGKGVIRRMTDEVETFLSKPVRWIESKRCRFISQALPDNFSSAEDGIAPGFRLLTRVGFVWAMNAEDNMIQDTKNAPLLTTRFLYVLMIPCENSLMCSSLARFIA